MGDDRERRSGNRAYEDWEAAGRPGGAPDGDGQRAEGGAPVPSDAVPGDAVAADAVPRVPPSDAAPADRGGAPAEEPPVTAPGKAPQGAHVAGADGGKGRERPS